MNLLDLGLSSMASRFDSRAALLEEVKTFAIIRIDVIVDQPECLPHVVDCTNKRACNVSLRLRS